MRRRRWLAGGVATALALPRLLRAAGNGRRLTAHPRNYLDILPTLKPGDTLLLAPGLYGVNADGSDDLAHAPGLPVVHLNGTADAPITITGPASGPRPLFLGRATHNTVRVEHASHVVLRHLDIDCRNLGGAGVATRGITHHVTLEGLRIRGVGGNQQQVGIRCNGGPAWGWVIRGNEIAGAGTGLYLGQSDGSSPFVDGLVERNLVLDSIGYNLQVKHQHVWASLPPGMPGEATTTVIRHNVFAKRSDFVSPDGARPNVLVGDQPPSGPGAHNGFAIYGNFFWRNPTEVLFQGEGRIALYANLMVNDAGSALLVRPHNGAVREVRVFGNTVLARDTGIAISGGNGAAEQRVWGNAVFAGTPLRLAGDASAADNASGSRREAAEALAAPDAPLPGFDATPLPGRLQGAALDRVLLAGLRDAGLDFHGRARGWATRGAIEPGTAGWRPALEFKP